MRTSLLALILLSAIALAGCEDADAVKSKETAQKLVGTWLREITVPEGKARRVLILGADGKFSESLVATFADGRQGKEQRSGEWVFDGTNLKRRYTHEDGRQIGSFNFVTFELTALTNREFEGENHVQGEKVHYQRVADGTTP